MQNQLQRAINLAKKTGDKLIVFDSAKAEEACIILPLKDYENLVLNNDEKNLTEDELLDKVNCDIAMWKSKQEDEQMLEKNDKISVAEDQIEQEKIEQNNENSGWTTEDNEDRKKNKDWSIPSARKINAEEVLEEDRQYLEEVLS